MNHDGASDHDPRQELKPDASPSADLPEEKPHPEYRINIFRDWCKGCGICAAFCPRHCLGLDAEGNPVVEKSANCTGCRWCELHCPDFAICVREVEKAAEDQAKP
jgi:2-oxoglutarate ferredoxin oxidoreductase subunit delta